VIRALRACAVEVAGHRAVSGRWSFSRQYQLTLAALSRGVLLRWPCMIGEDGFDRRLSAIYPGRSPPPEAGAVEYCSARLRCASARGPLLDPLLD